MQVQLHAEFRPWTKLCIKFLGLFYTDFVEIYLWLLSAWHTLGIFCCTFEIFLHNVWKNVSIKKLTEIYMLDLKMLKWWILWWLCKPSLGALPCTANVCCVVSVHISIWNNFKFDQGLVCEYIYISCLACGMQIFRDYQHDQCNREHSEIVAQSKWGHSVKLSVHEFKYDAAVNSFNEILHYACVEIILCTDRKSVV